MKTSKKPNKIVKEKREIESILHKVLTIESRMQKNAFLKKNDDVVGFEHYAIRMS